jgi:phenylalanine-4-hydroxylase
MVKPIYIYKRLGKQLGFTRKRISRPRNFDNPDGFGSPIGKLEGIKLAIEDMSPKDSYNAY